MVSLNHLIYDLWQTLTPLISDDSILDERQLAYWVKTQRALWLKNELNKGFRTIDDNIIQSLGAVEMEVVDRIENNPYTGSSKILRSKLKIPVAIELHYGTAITRVGPLDIGKKAFKFVDYSTIPYVGKGKFNRNDIYCFLKGGYLYLISDCNNPIWKSIKYINVRGVFEDPEEVGLFTEIDGTSCWTYDSQFPVNMWLINYLKDAIIKADLKYFVSPNVDLTNDASIIPLNNNNEKGEKQNTD